MGNAERTKLIMIDGMFANDHRILEHEGYDDVLCSVLLTSTPLTLTSALLIEYRDESRCQTLDLICMQELRLHPFEADQFGSILWYLLGYHFADIRIPLFQEENLFAVSRNNNVKIFRLNHTKSGAGRSRKDNFKLIPIRDEMTLIQSPRIFHWIGVDVFATR